jgi:hypothetical protein
MRLGNGLSASNKAWEGLAQRCIFVSPQGSPTVVLSSLYLSKPLSIAKHAHEKHSGRAHLQEE